MGKMGKLLWSLGALTALGPAVAWADGFQNYHVCGGDAFTTCAAVQIKVVGKDVTVNIWNLSGSTSANLGTQSSGNTILNGIGFYNLPPGVKIRPGTVTVSGPARSGDQPSGWKFSNKGSIGFPVGISGNVGSGVNNSIANGCATSLPTGKNLQLFENQGCGEPSNGGWVTYHFRVRGSWDPTKSDIVLRGVQVQRGKRGKLSKVATECWTGNTPNGARANCVNITPGPGTVTPEPVTMTLLATGLAGVGGVGFFRRRKKGNQPS